MTPIITPALVRRYLLATGQAPEELRVFDALATGEEALDGFLQDFAIDRARLGLLVAAEDMLGDAAKETAAAARAGFPAGLLAANNAAILTVGWLTFVSPSAPIW